METLAQYFSVICGQDPAHSWGALPLCQRCTGLYTGAAVAVLLHRIFKPSVTGRFLWANGACLLLMVPFGFHWVPQGPALRAMSGALFGVGLVTFLSLPWRPATQTGAGGPVRYFAAGICAWVLLVPLVGAYGGAPGRGLLCWLSCAGALALAALAAADFGWWAVGTLRLFRLRLGHRHARA